MYLVFYAFASGLTPILTYNRTSMLFMVKVK